MASVYSTPYSVSCAHFMSTQTSSSVMPLQWPRSCFRASTTLQLQVPSAITASIPSIPQSFSWKSKNPPRSVKTASAPPGNLAVVTDDTWEECVLNSDIPVLVEFWTAWCGPCMMVHREMEEIAKEYCGRIKCYMVRADVEIVVVDKYDINVVPVVMLFKNGEIRDSVAGTMPYYIYTTALEKLLSS